MNQLKKTFKYFCLLYHMNEKLIFKAPTDPLPKHEIYAKSSLRQPELSPRTVLFREGLWDRLYIILDVSLEIIKALGTPDEQLLNICIPGDYIGEMCLLDPDRSRTASVRTSSPVKLLELTRADLDTLLHSYPIIGYAMARVLSQRLKASETKMLAELNRKNSQLSQAYSYLQSLLPQLTEIKRVGKQENKGHFTFPPDFDIQDNTIH